MYVVYWICHNGKIEHDVNMQGFNSDDMSSALSLMEELRQDTNNRFISLASENPNSVGKQGSVAPSADYSWTKRRFNERDPSVAISRTKSYNANDEVEVPLEEE